MAGNIKQNKNMPEITTIKTNTFICKLSKTLLVITILLKIYMLELFKYTFPKAQKRKF